jgi:hypothetical protein
MITGRREYFKHYTRTPYTLPDGQQRYFLELPWRDNEIGKSCIPEDTYIVDRDHTGRMRYYALRNEQTYPRTHIEIHPATYLRHLEGCLSPCMSIAGGERTSEPVAVGSIGAMNELLEWFGEDSWVLKLTS